MNQQQSKIVSLRSAKKPEKHDDSWVAVGKIVKAVGLAGWVKVVLLTDNPDRFVAGASLHIRSRDNKISECLVTNVRAFRANSDVQLQLDGCSDRNKAGDMVGSYLVIPIQERAAISDKYTFYPDELAGMQVLSIDNECIGRVLKLESEHPAPYLITEINGIGEVLIPFRKVFIENVSRSDATVKLKHPVDVHVPRE